MAHELHRINDQVLSVCDNETSTLKSQCVHVGGRHSEDKDDDQI